MQAIVRATRRPRFGLLFLLMPMIALETGASAADLPDVAARVPWTLSVRNESPGAEYVVYTRKPPGSKFSTYRLEAVLDFPLKEVASIAHKNISDPEFRPKNTVKTILRNDGEVMLVHSHIIINAPFISDRDVISRVERSYDPATQAHTMSWKATNEGPPPKDGVIRLNRSEGFWRFTPTPEGSTLAVYVSHTEIAGSIPAWVVNSVMSDTMVQGIEGLRKSLTTQADLIAQ
jgi:hypothetical protein